MSAETEREERGRRGKRRGRRPRAADELDAKSPRTGARRTIMHVIRRIPDYLRLLAGLVTDRQVSTVDKLLVAGAIAYIIAPVDFIPDVIPFFGQVDDIFLLTSAVERLVINAGAPVLLRHWPGDPSELSMANLRQVMSAAAFFLPRRMKRRLRKMARR